MHTSDHHGTTIGSIVDGMLLVSSSSAHNLFDTNASHSFISMLFASMLRLEYEPLESTLSVGVCHASNPGVVADVSFCKTSDLLQFKIIYLVQNISNK